MTIDAQRLLEWTFPDTSVEVTEEKAILYALGVGLGGDPSDLRYVYERDLQVLPTMVTAIGGPGLWVAKPETGITWQKVVHAEHSMTVNRPLVPGERLTGRARVHGVFDRGVGKGALIQVQRELIGGDGAVQSQQLQSMIARGDGGFGGPPVERKAPVSWPDRAPDAIVDRAISERAALIYRLSGDMNPLHADPAIAEVAGFQRPILHGLCTYAIAGWSLAVAVGGGDATRLRRLEARFSSPVYPGERLRTEIWADGGNMVFRSTAIDRGVVALDEGHAEFFPWEAA